LAPPLGVAHWAHVGLEGDSAPVTALQLTVTDAA
jgi:hypothetical protein